MVKQIILAREDLCMSPGKLAAQVAHASIAVFLNKKEILPIREMMISLTESEYEWLTDSFTKVVLGVSSLEQLENICGILSDNGIRYSFIEDSGRTEFNGEQTVTCVGIEPLEASVIDKITGNLRLYKQRSLPNE